MQRKPEQHRAAQAGEGVPSGTPSPLAGAPASFNIRSLILVLGSLTAFAPFATDMYLASFSRLAAYYDTDEGTVQLGLSLFFLGMSLGQLIYGPLVDRLGRKRPLLVGIAVFALSSLAITVAPTIDAFVALRFVQALGGCAGMIVARAVIRDLFDAREGARVLSLLIMVLGVAPVIAPVLGSYILLFADWQAIFLFLAAWGVVGFVTTWRVLPETLPPEARRREGAAQIAASYLHLVTRRGFIVPALSSGLVFGGLFAFISGSPYVYMELHGVDAQTYGWLFAIAAGGMIAAAQINRILLKRFAPGAVLFGALTVNLAAAAILLVTAPSAALVWLVVPLSFSVGTVPLVAANAVAIAMAATGRHAGSGSAIVGLLQFALASAVSAMIGFLHNGTAYPMAGAIFACSLAAMAVWVFGRERTDAAAPSRP